VLVAARFTFRRLFLAGLTALLADAVGFAVLLVIDIQVIRELAIAASIGVAVLIFTNLILLPILLSYTGVSAKAAARAACAMTPRRQGNPVWAGAGSIHATSLGHRRRAVRRAAGAGRWGVEPATADRRPRPRSAGAARRQPLQPRCRLHEHGLRRGQRHAGRDGAHARGAVRAVRRP
jgi:hypothetical protein